MILQAAALALLRVAVLVPLAVAHPRQVVPLAAVVLLLVAQAHLAAVVLQVVLQARHQVLLLVFHLLQAHLAVVPPQVLKFQNQVWIQPMLLQPTKPLL